MTMMNAMNRSLAFFRPLEAVVDLIPNRKWYTITNCITIIFLSASRCVARNTVGESSTTLHLIVKAQLNVIVEPDLMVADFGSNAEFTCKAYHKDGPDDDGQGEKDYLASCHTTIKLGVF